jgi:hypothetical protein
MRVHLSVTVLYAYCCELPLTPVIRALHGGYLHIAVGEGRCGIGKMLRLMKEESYEQAG